MEPTATPVYLVFDLETVGFPLEYFDEARQDYLLRGAVSDEDRDKKIDEFALSPLTGRIVCIGMQLVSDVEERDTDGNPMGRRRSSKSVAYMVDDTMTDSDAPRSTELGDGSVVHYSSESRMLINFWKLLEQNRSITLVSFNGRNFDAPWLMLRSAVLGIRPSRNLMEGTKFNYPNHIDLLDKLTFYQPSQQGATRRFNFDFYAKAFGIVSPKEAGVDGSMVGVLFSEGRLEDIAAYCLRDVAATWQLYEVWERLLR